LALGDVRGGAVTRSWSEFSVDESHHRVNGQVLSCVKAG
jgi:hypothetical protein